MVGYLLRGLDAFDLEFECDGSVHFLHNLMPEMYDLRSIQLINGKVNLFFAPGQNLPEPLQVRKSYRLTLAANEKIEIISKQLTEDDTTIYVVINCKTDEEGRQFFHYDILKKAEEDGENSHIPLGVTINELVEQGFVTTRSEDCSKLNQCRIIMAA